MISSIAWADDLLITSLSKEGLQKFLNSLSTYCEKWGLVVSMKKTRSVIFSKGHIKYDILQQFIIGDVPVPFKSFYKYLGVDISDNCEFNLVKRERVKCAKKALIVIKQALSTSGNISVPLAIKLFETKIEPILTYGGIIWGIENNSNSVEINNVTENSLSCKTVIDHMLKELWDLEDFSLDSARRVGKRQASINRPIIVKFCKYYHKEKLLYSTRLPGNITVKNHCNYDSFKDIELVQDNFIKYTLNISKYSSNYISRAEAGRFPL